MDIKNKTCCERGVKNFSFNPSFFYIEEKIIHYYCGACGSHYFRNKIYSKKEWDEYINEEDWVDK